MRRAVVAQDDHQSRHSLAANYAGLDLLLVATMSDDGNDTAFREDDRLDGLIRPLDLISQSEADRRQMRRQQIKVFARQRLKQLVAKDMWLWLGRHGSSPSGQEHVASLSRQRP